MPIIRVHQQHTSDWLRGAAEDALSWLGEPVFYVSLFSSLTPGPARCPACWDDVYRSTSTSTTTGAASVCARCLGTTFDGGVAKLWWTSAIFGQADVRDRIDVRDARLGQSTPDRAQVKVSWPQEARRGDLVVRVLGWARGAEDGLVRPGEVEVWKTVDSPVRATVKDGFHRTDRGGVPGGASRLLGVGSALVCERQDVSHPLHGWVWPGFEYGLVARRRPFVWLPEYEGPTPASKRVLDAPQ